MSTFSSKSGVNVRRLVQNIQDQYDFAPQIATLLELVANALDAHATKIKLQYSSEHGRVIVEDDGHGMNEAQFKNRRQGANLWVDRSAVFDRSGDHRQGTFHQRQQTPGNVFQTRPKRIHRPA